MTSPIEPLAEYETAPMPSLDDAQLRAIVDRHAIDLDGPIVRLPSTGVVHALWTLGPDLVLRVPKDEPMCLADHRCESVAIPLALRAGARTPELRVFDDTLSILDVPFSIVSRVHGDDLSQAPFDQPAYVRLGSELARLHSADLADGDHPWLRRPDEHDLHELLDVTVEAGLLHAEAARWLTALHERSTEVIGSGPPPPRTFVHGDVKPDNVMVEPTGTVQLIDWGDAGFGDPAHDFPSLPMHSIELVLRGYRTERSDDPTLEARIVQRVVIHAVHHLRRTPRTGPSWYRPVAARLTDMLTFAIDRRDTWERWLTVTP